ncbi:MULTISPECIES: hypothetical protein [Parageobacillus]|nr:MULTISPECIES: hypothetical protein [Parageobacillus]BDG48784.1 hypothetical protein PspKH34_33450 [Parageobacillus sp. KH3-4]
MIADGLGFCKKCHAWLNDKEYEEHPGICSDCIKSEDRKEVSP